MQAKPNLPYLVPVVRCDVKLHGVNHQLMRVGTPAAFISFFMSAIV